MKNEFFKEKTKGPTKELTLQEVLYMVIGGRCYFSKRLAPPLAVCNARIYCGDEFVFSSDIDLMQYKNDLHSVSLKLNVDLEVFYEHGDNVIWSSKDPNRINIGGIHFYNFDDAYAYMKPICEAQVRRWKIDHGLARRNCKEWFQDFRSRVYFYFYPMKRWINKKCNPRKSD